MNQKKLPKSENLSKNQLRRGKLERVHHEPPSHRLDNFNPMKIAEGKRKEKRHRLGSRSCIENLSGMIILKIRDFDQGEGYKVKMRLGFFLSESCFDLDKSSLGLFY